MMYDLAFEQVMKELLKETLPERVDSHVGTKYVAFAAVSGKPEMGMSLVGRYDSYSEAREQEAKLSDVMLLKIYKVDLSEVY